MTGMKKPGQPIQVKERDFLQPERAETRPPEDILKWYSPLLSFVIVMGRRFETTISFCFPSPPDPFIAGDMMSATTTDRERKRNGV